MIPGAYSAHRAKHGSRSLWVRAPASALIATAGAMHLYLWFDYFHRVHVIGALFLANAASAALIAAALLVIDLGVVLLVGLGYAATTLIAFLVSTKWGLAGYHERFWAPWQEAAAAVELTIIGLIAATLIARQRQER